MSSDFRNLSKEKMLIDILTEKHRRTFIVKDLMDKIIEIKTALRDSRRKYSSIKTMGKMIL